MQLKIAIDVVSFPQLTLKPSLTIPFLSLASGLLLTPCAMAQGRLNEPTFFEEGREQFEREIERLQQTQPAPIITIDADIQQWQPISSQAGGFSVWAPLGILLDDTETVSVGTADVDFRILSSQTSLGRFVVAYADQPDIETSELFAAIKDALVERTAFEISTIESIKVDGNIGKSLILTSDTGLISAYILLGNNRVYVVGVRQTEGNEPSEAAKRFLTSFHLSTQAY